MPATLASGLNRDLPLNIVISPKQDALAQNGWNYWLRWDGITAAAEESGMQKPGLLLVQSTGAGGGSLTGPSYVCGVRWVDDDGQPGDFSITTVNLDPGHGALEWFLSGYADIFGAPPRAATLELWRSLAGETAVLYPLIYYPADDLAAVPTVVESYTDAELIAQTGASMGLGYQSGVAALTVVNADGSLPATGLRFGMPPGHMSAVVQHKNRLYAAVPTDYSTGMVELTNGDSDVIGIGTDWDTNVSVYSAYYTYSGPQQARSFKRLGDTTAHGLSLTAQNAGILTTSGAAANYAGTTSNFAQYSIYLPPAEYLKVCYSYIGEDVEPESWPANYTFQCHAPGGRITALLLAGSDLFIAKQAKLYCLSVQRDPAIDGELRLAENHRGCENQRTWCQAEGAAYVMDRQGIYAWDGANARDISEPIQDYFREGKINWSRAKTFQAVYDQEAATVMFFVCMASSTSPRQALCYSLKTRAWSIYEWGFRIGSAAVVALANRRRVLMGCEHATIRVSDTLLDGVAPDTTGTLRGKVTASSLCRLEDSTATFSSACVGTIVAIVDGLGKGQSRRITEVSATALTLLYPWTTLPDTTSVYQIGGFQWEWTSTMFRYTQRSQDTTREFCINYQPTDHDTHLYFARFHNFNLEGTPWGSLYDTGDTMQRLGVLVRGADPDALFNLKRKRNVLATEDSEAYDDTGFARLQYDGNSDVKGQADRNVAIKIHGHQGPSPVRIYRLTIDGVRV